MIDVDGDVEVTGGEITLRLAYRPFDGERIVLIESDSQTIADSNRFDKVFSVFVCLMYGVEYNDCDRLMLC